MSLVLSNSVHPEKIALYANGNQLFEQREMESYQIDEPNILHQCTSVDLN
jgi:hypothetical protein